MPAANKSLMTLTIASDREVILSRTFQAPRALVFAAMTTPEHLRHWFGPRGYSLPTCEVDLRVGGSWRYVLRGPDGSEMGMRGTYREIVRPERIVSTEAYDIPGLGWTPESVVTTTLVERDGKTTLTSHILYQSIEHRDGHVGSGMEGGAAETFDRLAELLGSMAAKA